MAVVPSELMARVQRQWVWFVVLAVVSLLLAASSITGWLLYIRASRAEGVSQDSVADLQNRIGGLEKELADRQARLDATTQALAKAEAGLAGMDDLRDFDKSRVTTAERERAEAQAKIEAVDRARAEVQAKFTAAERAQAELEKQFEEARAGRTDAESKLEAANTARSAAELQAGDAQRAVSSLKDQIARLEADVQRYRDEAQDARAEERKMFARWQDAMTARLPGDPHRPTTAAPAGPDSAQLEGGRLRNQAPLAPATPAHPVSTASATQPGTEQTRPTEGAMVTAIVGRDPSAARPEPRGDDDDPALKDANPLEMRGWGEAMIVGGNPERAVTLIRKAIQKGGEGAGYQKSLGWALLRAGREKEAKAALEAALIGFEDWPATSAKTSPDHWTAAFLLGRVPEDEYTRRYNRVTLLGYRLDCLPWFYVGQRRELEGHREEALTAYRACVELGQLPNAYPIWKWASQRVEELAKPPATAPAQ